MAIGIFLLSQTINLCMYVSIYLPMYISTPLSKEGFIWEGGGGGLFPTLEISFPP